MPLEVLTVMKDRLYDPKALPTLSYKTLRIWITFAERSIGQLVLYFVYICLGAGVSRTTCITAVGGTREGHRICVRMF